MFEEEKHPRDNDGKFTDKHGAKNVYDSRGDMNNIKNSISIKGKNKLEFFGEEFKGYKGGAAVEKLLKEKRGHIKNAFERPEIGGIDLVWGDKKGGLLHTIQKRDKLLADGVGHISGLDMARKIPVIIQKGEFDIDEQNRPGFVYDNCRVAVRPEFYGEKLNWVVTAMENLKIEKS